MGRRDRVRLIVGAGVLLAIGFARWVPGAAIGPVAAAAWVGLVLIWCGISLRFWSFHTLGRYFTFVVQTSGDQPVITARPYRVIRHPSYAGLLLGEIGASLYIENWLSVVALTVMLAAGLVYRIGVEERALRQNLGANYRDYAANHKRLVPFIW